MIRPRTYTHNSTAGDAHDSVGTGLPCYQVADPVRREQLEHVHPNAMRTAPRPGRGSEQARGAASMTPTTDHGGQPGDRQDREDRSRNSGGVCKSLTATARADATAVTLVRAGLGTSPAGITPCIRQVSQYTTDRAFIRLPAVMTIATIAIQKLGLPGFPCPGTSAVRAMDGPFTRPDVTLGSVRSRTCHRSLHRSWAAAQVAIWVREVKPSLVRMFSTWSSAVRGGDDQFGGDLRVAQALGDQLADLAFPAGQRSYAPAQHRAGHRPRRRHRYPCR